MEPIDTSFNRDGSLCIVGHNGRRAFRAYRTVFAKTRLSSCYPETPVVEPVGMRNLTVLMFLTALAPAPVLAAAPVPATFPSGLIQVGDDGIMVDNAWARASAGAATAGAAYMTVMGGAQPDTLVGASTPVATTAEVHESFVDGGMMRMRPVGSLPVPSGKTVTFAPGGYHIMLMNLSHPLMAGETFPLTLKFEHAAPLTINVQVRPIGAAAAAAGHDTMQMK
jgi:copper(I)-binding protein